MNEKADCSTYDRHNKKDMVGCYGNEKMKTPNLDRLAQEGIRYENAYTCQPVCGPARGAIFTGAFPHTNGVVTNSIGMGDNVKNNRTAFAR